MYFDEWISNVKGKTIDKDGYYGGQCMDLYNDYCEKVLGLKNTGCSQAKDIIYNAVIKANCKIVKNYPDYIPPRGAIAVWRGWKYGHVAMVLCADRKCFQAIEQNWNGVQVVKEIFHDYDTGTPLYFLEPNNRTNIDRPQPTKPQRKYKVGDRVVVSTYYASSTAPVSKAYYPKTWKTGTITRVLDKDVHNPYLLNNGNLGWCNDGDIRQKL